MAKAIDYRVLKCPNCSNGSFLLRLNEIRCSFCDSSYEKNQNAVYFKFFDQASINDPLDRFKFFLKKFSAFYSFLVNVISPVYPTRILKEFISQNVKDDTVAINLGSGNSDLSELISNVDIFKYPNVNLTCDLLHLPIKDQSVDVIINIAVLEHVQEPEQAVKEFERVLKDNGRVICFFPFIQGGHASPNDFSRRTLEGIKFLFKNFEITEVKAFGPTSGFLWVFQSWCALMLSLGSRRLYYFFNFLIMFLTFPIKYLDFFLNFHPNASDIATGVFLIAKKVSLKQGEL